ncbi:hypothetical protein BCIN_01g05030 [Botrytis cinerea B05.10]|uniref:Uncharacterized protein n=1 Tax=Botryotinia fuckeliana (strain B05.10) TaxID=332648 RepID=A0A384J5P5_BOTFB|nr:hypothetical protein BCIN_01g05030 [Botrytis cinerea B05.10]ATZ45782.1 hypothetical protein BCIN_01g05030 [Botrytis cinerea B05.10]
MSILPQYDQILQSSGIHLCGTRTLTVSKGWHWHIGHSSPARSIRISRKSSNILYRKHPRPSHRRLTLPDVLN